MAEQKVLVLGAGLAGLNAARHLQRQGLDCHVFEKELRPGGLCRSKTINGFTFDIAGHLLHFKKASFLKELKKILQEKKMDQHKRSAWIYSWDRYTKYPFQANFYGLPSDVAKECLVGFIESQQGADKDYEYKTFLQWINGKFGRGVAKHFMVPYNTKFWTSPPGQMTCEWLQGFVPQPTLRQVVLGSSKESRQSLGYNASFWYPHTGGIENIVDVLRERVENIHVRFEVAQIDLEKKTIFFKNGEQRRFDKIVSTIPLPEMALIIKNLPQNVRRAIGCLRWNSIFNVNFGLEQNNRTDKHWVYFPEKQFSFFRVGFFHNFSKQMVPCGGSSLYAEVAYSERRPIDKKTIVARIQKDLLKGGIVAPSDRFLVTDTNDIYYGYPICDKKYSLARSQVEAYLDSQGVLLCGRYGRWRYMSMEDALVDGQEVAERLIRS